MNKFKALFTRKIDFKFKLLSKIIIIIIISGVSKEEKV